MNLVYLCECLNLPEVAAYWQQVRYVLLGKLMGMDFLVSKTVHFNIYSSFLTPQVCQPGFRISVNTEPYDTYLENPMEITGDGT